MVSVRFPASATEAEEIAASTNGAYVAGGTALQLAWSTPSELPSYLIDLTRLAGASAIDLQTGTLRIGAGVRLEHCRTHPLVMRHSPLLVEACGVIGALSIRNLGTLGGNICWRQGDTLPALLVLEAVLEFADGIMVPMSEWLQDRQSQHPPRVLIAVHLPQSAQQARCFLEKVGHRATFTPTKVLACGALMLDRTGRIDAIKVAISGVGLPATRLAVGAEAAGCEVGSHAWRPAFEQQLQSALAALPTVSDQQRQILHRLIAGHLYLVCERRM